MLNQDELYWSNNWNIDFWVCIHIYRYIQHDTCVRFLTFWSGDGHVAPICVLGFTWGDQTHPRPWQVQVLFGSPLARIYNKSMAQNHSKSLSHPELRWIEWLGKYMYYRHLKTTVMYRYPTWPVVASRALQVLWRGLRQRQVGADPSVDTAGFTWFHKV